MLSLLCTLPFGVFSGRHIFHQFRQQTFFSAHIFNKLFFLTFVATYYFFYFFLAHPPPPAIKWCVPLNIPRNRIIWCSCLGCPLHWLLIYLSTPLILFYTPLREDDSKVAQYMLRRHEYSCHKKNI